jgi:N-acetylmuramoyl-L-alanine amidase
MRAINRVIVHHSASPLHTTAESIYHYHTTVNEWSDTGYHFVIEQHGRIVPARPIDKMGAHCRHDGNNRRSIGICLVGNNIDAQNKWTAAQIESGGKLVAALRLIFPGSDYMGHRDTGAATLCPGTNVRELWGE